MQVRRRSVTTKQACSLEAQRCNQGSSRERARGWGKRPAWDRVEFSPAAAATVAAAACVRGQGRHVLYRETRPSELKGGVEDKQVHPSALSTLPAAIALPQTLRSVASRGGQWRRGAFVISNGTVAKGFFIRVEENQFCLVVEKKITQSRRGGGLKRVGRILTRQYYLSALHRSSPRIIGVSHGSERKAAFSRASGVYRRYSSRVYGFEAARGVCWRFARSSARESSVLPNEC